jgi:hypothetical protein
MRRALCTYCGEELASVDTESDLSKQDDSDELLGVCEQCLLSIAENDDDRKEQIRLEESQQTAYRRILGFGCLIVAIGFAIALAFDVARGLRAWFSIE